MGAIMKYDEHKKPVANQESSGPKKSQSNLTRGGHQVPADSNPTSHERRGRVGPIVRQVGWVEVLADDGGTKEVVPG